MGKRQHKMVKTDYQSNQVTSPCVVVFVAAINFIFNDKVFSLQCA